MCVSCVAGITAASGTASGKLISVDRRCDSFRRVVAQSLCEASAGAECWFLLCSASAAAELSSDEQAVWVCFSCTVHIRGNYCIVTSNRWVLCLLL